MSSHNSIRMDIACVVDSNYTPHLAALVKSIEHNAGSEEITIHIVHDDVPDNLRGKVETARPNVRLVWYAVKDHVALSLPPFLQISRASYLRLILDELLDPSLGRILYIDIDVIVAGSLRPLWESDLGDAACGAVVDPGVDAVEFAARHGLPAGGGYFNAGVMLLDMERIRERRIFADALAVLLAGGREFHFGDQDGLNIALWKNWRALDATWNFQREFLYDDLRAWRSLSKDTSGMPRIVHFTERLKPWSGKEWHPFAWLYWKYLLKTPFHAEVARREGVRTWTLLKMAAKFRLKRPALGRR